MVGLMEENHCADLLLVTGYDGWGCDDDRGCDDEGYDDGGCDDGGCDNMFP